MFVSRTVSEIFSVKKECDIESGSRGRSRSLKIAPFIDHKRLSIGPPL